MDKLHARIAELEQELRALRDSARFLDSIVENIPNMVFVKDADELRFKLFNRAGEELLGYAREDLLGRNDADFFPPEEASFFTEKDQAVLEQGVLHDIPEESIHTANGTRYLHTQKIPILDDDGKPLFLLGISEDITKKKEAQVRLKALLRRFPGALWTTDSELRLTSSAGAHAERLGIAGTHKLGHELAELSVVDGPGEAGMEAHHSALAGEATSYEFRRGGRIYEVRVEPLLTDPVTGVIGVALDATERRRLDAEKLQARLRATQKLELLGVMAGGIAHDFNNLLGSILGNASLALRKLPETSSAREPIERVVSSAEHAADLTRQLLAYSGKGRFVVQTVDLSEVVQDIARVLKVSVSKRANMRVSLAEGLPPIRADLAQLRQLTMNLITNASDALDGETGTISLTTGKVYADSGYLADAYSDAELPEGWYVSLEVSDTGIGMDEDTRGRMFEPFFTTKETGHGLGLAATLGIVRGHGGAIRVYSEQGSGTTVKVIMPAARDGLEERAPTPSRRASGMGGRVLVVDDDKGVREMAQGVLEHGGYAVVMADDGEAGLELFREAPDAIDLVLLDMTMPRMGGEETFRELRRIRPNVLVILSSGYNEQETTSQFAGKGLAGFLQKPYRSDDLLKLVARILNA